MSPPMAERLSFYPYSFQVLRGKTLAIRLPGNLRSAIAEQGAKQMAEDVEREIVGGEETVAEVRLWQAVVVRAIEDWMTGPTRQQRQAEHYIFDKKTDFVTVCERAGLNADDLRARLSRLRSRPSQQQERIAA
jgi:hypothetical protein